MVICIAARRIWTHGFGGIETYCRSVAEELVRQGHTVHVVTTSHPSGRTQEMYQGAHIYYLQGTPPGDYSRVWWNASRAWGQEYFGALGVEAIWSISMAGQSMVEIPDAPPLFLTIHGYGWRQLRSFWHDSRGYQKLVKFPREAVWLLVNTLSAQKTLRKAAGVIAASQELYWLLRRYRTHLVPNMVDTSQFRPDPVARAATRSALRISDGDLVALMVGTVNWQKGFDLGLRACAEVATEVRELRGLVVGDGPRRDELARWAHTEAPHLAVSFVGAQANEALPPYYAASDIFLFPSRREESWPTLVMIEAMATGLPLIWTRPAGTTPAVRDQETGLLTSINDLRGFTEALRILVDDPARRQTLGAAGRRVAEGTFDVRIVVARLVEIMNGTAQTRTVA